MNRSDIDRISPVFIAWHDTGKSLHRYSSDTYGERVVQHYEMEYIVSSRSGYILTDGIPVPTIPKNVFFRFPGMVAEGIGVYHSIYVEFDLNEDGEKTDMLQALVPVVCDAENDLINAGYFELLCLSADATAAEKLLWKAKVLRLLAFLIQYGKEEPQPVLYGEEKKCMQPVKSAITYVQMHFDEHITLQDLADTAGYSTYYFCKLFKQVTQLTPMQYVVRYRMEQAKKRLLTSDKPTEMVMLEVGFRNYSYFWRAFKEIYGFSPQDYRKKFSG